jgi:hypothetical protein
VIGVVLATLTVIALARCQLAFRADHAGILLPGEPDRLTARRGPGVLIPWADVEQIILYSSEPGTASSAGTPALSSATWTRSGAGLLDSTSPAKVAASIASSASRAARSAWNSGSSAELASTTASPRCLEFLTQ